ncbi:hypothetical protein N2152v2_010391 [Parachlorella kessleri]
MSSMGDSTGEGGGGSGFGRSSINTGYGTHDGKGNVETDVRSEEGTGYDESGQVKTGFGKYPIGYDPVTGTATAMTTSGYDFPAEGGATGTVSALGAGGLADISAPGSATATKVSDDQAGASESFKDAMETYFANRDATEREQGEQQQQQQQGGQQGQEDTGAPALLRTGAQGGL